LKVFSNYAQYYDLLNQGKDYKRETEYIISLLKKYSPNSKILLDLGCGTGIHDIHFAENGYDIIGIDQSETMINIANERLRSQSKLSNSIKFLVGDIRDIKIDKRFDSTISLFHVMSYQNTDNDLDKSFQTVSNHLKQGGLFIFDCWYGPAVLSDEPYKRTKTFENNEIFVKRTSTPTLHLHNNSVDVRFDIEITDKTTNDKEQVEELHKMRYLFEPEIESFLTKNRLELLQTESWLEGEEPSTESWYVTFICKKL